MTIAALSYATSPSPCANAHLGLARRTCRAFAFAAACALFGLACALPARAHELVPCAPEPLIDEIVQRVNAARAHGAVCHRSGETMVAGPVHYSQTLAAAATHLARDMARLNQMRHRDGDDRGLAERLRLVDYRFGKAVENVAVGYATVDAVLQAWIASEGHCDNLMNSGVVELGLACSEANLERGPGHIRYWALLLARPNAEP